MPRAPLPAPDRAAPRRQAPRTLLLAALVQVWLATHGLAQPPAYPPVTVAIAAQALAEAIELDRAGQPTAVDLYFRAATMAAHGIQPVPTPDQTSVDDIYVSAVSGLIDSGQRYGRLDPRGRLVVMDRGPRIVPIHYHGFAWQPRDFSKLTSTEGQQRDDIANHYASPGIGVPLIGERIAPVPNEIFFRPWQPFAVTALLRPAAEMADPVDAASGYVLELYNPMVYRNVRWRGAEVPLARDLTAPLAATVNEVPRQYFRGFTAPTDTSVQPQLVMVEPYQRGKIPIVLIHGLYSDPITWVDMANELRSQPDLYQRYQYWTFRYPTGGDVLESAAVLRERLQLARETFDPEHTDVAMGNMVLVGHSLGGLVSKMQVTQSRDILWRGIAQMPFDALRAPPQVQLRLSRAMFFEPVPSVTRVIFIGTPHRGSTMTRRLAGQAGRLLVSFGTQEDVLYRDLMDANPNVFRPIVQTRRPTTIDMLDPDSPLLASLTQTPINRSTRLHSIIGTGGLVGEPGDGVVSVESARHPSDSERFVPARHERLHRDPESIAEVARILRMHAALVGAYASVEGFIHPNGTTARREGK